MQPWAAVAIARRSLAVRMPVRSSFLHGAARSAGKARAEQA